MKLALIGFGDLGHYIEDMVTEFHDVEEGQTAYFDDNLVREGAAGAFPFKDHAGEEFKDHHFYVSLGYKHLRTKNEIIARLVSLGRTLPHFVHPSAWVHPSVRIGSGSFVYPGCSIDRNTTIGRGTWITNADVIAHDCTIGDCCWFGATVSISGKVTVADQTFIGSGTVVANDVRVGANVIIGMGTAVTKNIPDSVSVIGNPFRILDRPLKLV